MRGAPLRATGGGEVGGSEATEATIVVALHLRRNLYASDCNACTKRIQM